MTRLATLLTILLAAPCAAAAMTAGAATVDITPPIGYPMWGYAARRDGPSVGVLDPLKARALVLTVGETRLAIVSLDLGRAPTRGSFASLRERVKADGVTHLFLVASHTHHGPILELDTWPDAKTPYTKQLEDKLASIIRDAAKSARPARWGVASREIDRNRNRHSKLPEPPVDRMLTVLRVEALDGATIAHVVNFAAHPTTTDGKVFKFSADYVGIMAARVEEKTGGSCLFLQGASGDLSAKADAGTAAFGTALADDVLTTAKGMVCKPADDLAVHDEEFKFTSRLDVTNPLVRAGLDRAFFPELVAFYEREYKEGVRPRMTVALLDGKLGLVGMSGEFFCGHALSLRRRARLDHVVFCGYCNDYQQYFPTIEAAAQGGYGAGPPMGLAEVGAGERMTDRALTILYQMRGRLE